MTAPEEINADMLAFWNGKGGDIWVARQEHTGPSWPAQWPFAIDILGGGFVVAPPSICLVVRQPAHCPCEAGTLVSSPLVILNVASFTRSHRRGKFFEGKFSGANSLAEKNGVVLRVDV